MLAEIGHNLWEATQPLKVAGFDLGHRMTVIREGGDLVIHSPIHVSSALVRDIEALGSVQHIAAPSKMHDLYLAEWLHAFPQAKLLHSPALSLKGIDTARAQPLARGSVTSLQIIPIEGMPKIQEFAFLHPPSRSLIVCDLVFNLPPGRGFQKILQKLNGIYEQVAPSKFFKAYITHDEAFRASIQEILALDFDRLVVGHGSNINNGAREHLQHAFAWLRLPEGE